MSTTTARGPQGAKPGPHEGDSESNGKGSQKGNGQKGNGGAVAGAAEDARPSARLADAMAFEPLARSSDADEYRDAYTKYKAGAWDEGQWTSFRLGFGVYGQLQPGVQMSRIKIPGGILPIEWARAIVALNRKYAGGPGTIHLTTRQDIQLYYIPLEDTPDYMADLTAAGITSREACGNTLRNMNGCMLAGVCPREHVDAGKVAEQLAHSWLRQPLVQHMPRKFKVSVSGCVTDCASSGIHDLGLVATQKDGKNGFIVYGGGGTGGQAIASVKLLDFAVEEDVPVVLEALVRLHQRYSDRVNRNRARLKFLIKRFGEEKFRALFLEEFGRIRGLRQRPWKPLVWRTPSQAPEPTSPGGVVQGHDGSVAVVVNLSLGLLTSDQFEALADIATAHGSTGFLVTRDQNLVMMGLAAGEADAVVAKVRALGLTVEDAPGDVADVVSCPGTTTCRLGITNSQNFAREIVDQVRAHAALRGLTVNVSGCQNGCGLHHVADFGFRGMGKKIDGVNAPHYQIYVGGNPRLNGAIAVAGPVVPARFALEALKMLMDSYVAERTEGESVREWALRLGKEGFRGILRPIIDKVDPANKGLFVDFGETEKFVTPEAAQAECAVSYAMDLLFQDLANDGLIGLDRAILGGHPAEGLPFGREAIYYVARRLLIRHGNEGEALTHDAAILEIRATYSGDARVISALDAVTAAEAVAVDGGDADAFREALAVWLDIASDLAAKPVEETAFDSASLGDSTGSVMAMLRSQGAVP